MSRYHKKQYLVLTSSTPATPTLKKFQLIDYNLIGIFY